MNRLRFWAPGPPREPDAQGSGDFGAGRGSRRHIGRDYVRLPGADVGAPVEGRVGRIGYCYADDPTYRLIEIQHDRAVCRVLYVDPCVEVGDVVYPMDTIGYAQDIAARYPGITPHVHVDLQLIHGMLMGKTGATPSEPVYVDPELFVF